MEQDYVKVYLWRFAVKLRYITLLIFFVSAVMLMLAPANSYAFRYRDYDITLRGDITQSYDSNINFDKENETDGFRTDAAISLGLNRSWRRVNLSLNGFYSHGIYNQGSDIGTGSESLRLSFGYEPSAYTSLQLNDSFSHSKEPTDFQSEFGRIAGRFNTYVNIFSLGLTRVISKDFSATASYGNTIVRKDEGTDSDGHSASIGLNYNYSVDKIFHFGYSYGFSKVEGEDSGTTGHRVFFGAEKYFTQRLTLTGRIAFGRNDSNASEDNTTGSVNVSLNQELDRLTAVRLSFALYNSDITHGDSNSDNWQISGDLRRELSDKINGSANVFYGEGTFRDIAGRDKLFGIGGKLDYEVSQRLRGYLSYSFSDLRSTDETRGYIRHLIGLGVSYVY